MEYSPPILFAYEINENPIKTYKNSAIYALNIKKMFNNENYGNYLYERNRPIDKEKVMEIIEHENKYMRKYGTYDFHLSKINLGTVNGKDIKILDGQHRIKAAINLEGDVECDIAVTDYNTEKDRFDAYLTINKNTIVDEFYKTSDDAVRYIIMESAKRFCNEHNELISDSRTPYRPHMNYHVLCEKLYEHFKKDEYSYYIDILNTKDSIENIVRKMNDYNNELLSRNNVNDYPRYTTKAKRENAFIKAIKSKMVLGMFTGYEWIISAYPKEEKNIINKNIIDKSDIMKRLTFKKRKISIIF